MSTREKTYGYKGNTEIGDGFYALLGSVLGKSMMHMLLEYKAEIGYRSVGRVVLLEQRAVYPAQQWGPARGLLIVPS